MLVLGRKAGDKITLNPGRPDQVVVEVLSVRPGRVILGFHADRAAVPIWRQELLATPEPEQEPK